MKVLSLRPHDNGTMGVKTPSNIELQMTSSKHVAQKIPKTIKSYIRRRAEVEPGKIEREID